MTSAYKTIPNPTYTNLHFIPIWQPATQHILTRLYYLHTYVPIYKFKVFSLHNIINNITCTNVKGILICSSVRRACTWKIVFKIQNNELNEFSECMLYKMFFFSRKHLKTVKLFFIEYFPEALLAYFKVSKTLCTCLLLKVYKTFNTCLLALLCFSLKVCKTFLNSLACLLYLACFKSL